MISAIQHYIFCPRQCGLIHVEDLWDENRFTARGRIMHERADSDSSESRGAVQIVRGLRIYCKELGLTGKADVVEFHKSGNEKTPFPVEYKSGKPKQNISDLAQLCAQALCLEEMTGNPVHKAAVYYGKPRKRLNVELTEDLRNATIKVIEEIHNMVQQRIVPKAKYMKKCNTCSLLFSCMPKTTGNIKLHNYIKGLFSTHEEAS